jgi:hypothetical protein
MPVQNYNEIFLVDSKEAGGPLFITAHVDVFCIMLY